MTNMLNNGPTEALKTQPLALEDLEGWLPERSPPSGTRSDEQDSESQRQVRPTPNSALTGASQLKEALGLPATAWGPAL